MGHIPIGTSRPCSGDIGTPLETPGQWITLAAFLLQTNFPMAASTIYNARSKGRLKWLCRTDSNGNRTRELWVHVPTALAWAKDRGWQITFDKDSQQCGGSTSTRKGGNS